MKQILLMIGMVALVGCGKKEPVQPSATKPEETKPETTKPEKERGKEPSQPTTPKGINQTSKVKIGTPIWESVTGSFVVSSPAIGSDGTVYVGSFERDKKLYAINGKSGVKLWEFQTGGVVYSSPAIGSEGTVYVGSNDRKLYAINGKSGVKLWEFETGWKVSSSPAIGPDGTVYVGSWRKVYAIKTESKGPAQSPWPMRGQNARHTGRVMKK